MLLHALRGQAGNGYQQWRLCPPKIVMLGNRCVCRQQEPCKMGMSPEYHGTAVTAGSDRMDRMREQVTPAMTDLQHCHVLTKAGVIAVAVHHGGLVGFNTRLMRILRQACPACQAAFRTYQLEFGGWSLSAATGAVLGEVRRMHTNILIDTEVISHSGTALMD
ncbi:hypothetical protein [Laribacter hongkongensis]|uniref:hypothetical protein n=1 Tax=Laribacter hongkongensis TaxID=168471 RepID=UPI001EFD18B2|nr:hypothetical protein [Laribacter hongkongensis]MCG9076648.1 hypothetical protein [Laribacter hongkongensis]